MKKKSNKFDVEVKLLTGWDLALDCARETERKEPIGKEPTDGFKRFICEAEHSPLRAVTFKVRLVNIPYFASVHLVRHKFGVEHFVSTQRTDRTGEDRNKKTQDSLVNHTMILNAQELMFISRRRLCAKADPTIIHIWATVCKMVKAIDPILGDYLVPMCHYRHCCPERVSCGYYKKLCDKALEDALADINKERAKKKGKKK